MLLSAVAATAAFPPLDWGFLAWIALVPLFYAITNARRPRHAAGLAYLFGFVHFGWVISWIGTTVTNWTLSPIGWVAWFFLTAIKSGWWALFGFMAWWIAAKSTGPARAIGFAAAWTLVEWFRGQTGVAMPWALIGYTQYRFLPLIQCADLAGVYLVTLALACVNAGVVGLLGRCRMPDARRLVLGPAILVAVMLVYGYVALNRDYAGPTVRLALMQPNIRSDRHDPEAAVRDLKAINDLAVKVAPQRPELIIWPETIAPTDAVTDPFSRQVFSRMALRTGAFVLAGTTYHDERDRSYNSAALFSPDGRLVTRYDKRWLVPMGEWVPLRSWMPFGDVFHFPTETTPGRVDTPVEAGPVRMSVLICYESVFPILPRIGAAEGANLMVSITNDSWAGRSSELDQHLAMTVFRAVETRRCVASAATTGVTGLIEPTGRINYIQPYQEDSLIAEAKLLSAVTPYVRVGDLFVGICAFYLAGMWIWESQKRRNGSGPDQPTAET